MIQAKQTYCGQYRPYGDHYRVWEIETDEPREAVVEYCFTNLYKNRVPKSGEWNLAITGEKKGDLGYYFKGYYFISPTGKGYRFTVCEPYAD